MTKPRITTNHFEWLAAIRPRYEQANRSLKTKILDEVVAVAGIHRKHAIRLLRSNSPNRSIAAKLTGTKPRPRIYDQGTYDVVIACWEASDRLCSKRLKAALPQLVCSLERFGHLSIKDDARRLLLTMSASTIDRILAQTRAEKIGHKPRRPLAATAIRRSVPIRTFADWNAPVPGYMEADLVSHSGPDASGSFAQTLTLTDIATGWTECAALLTRDGAMVIAALDKLHKRLPFALRGLDTDNGSEFINEVVIDYCKSKGIEQTRARPYRKNDQAWVEQKNGSVVRRLVGYERFEGLEQVAMLSRLYAASGLLVNYFQPSFKLASKTRVGAKVIKRYYPPETPAQRLASLDTTSTQTKTQLLSITNNLDPIRLLAEIRAMQGSLADRTRGTADQELTQCSADAQWLQSLKAMHRIGEVRPTHRRKKASPRLWRTREDPFAETWEQICIWLNEAPDLNAKALIDRLITAHPNAYGPQHLRTLQRRVLAWRRARAYELVFSSSLSGETVLANDNYSR